MSRRAADPTPNLSHEMARIFLINDRMDQLVLQHLDSRAWRAKLPGAKGRTIADIYAHVHNVRCKWLRLSAPHLKIPLRMDRRRCTQKQAAAALAESALRCAEMIEEFLAPQNRTHEFLRDGWARPWRPRAAMLAYMIAHEAHHRGQVCMLAHQLGFPLPVVAGAGIWGWEKLAKQCGFALSGTSKKTPVR